MGTARALGVDRRGITWGLVGVAVTLAITFFGSGRLLWFDAALIGYLFGVLFMVFGVLYRYTVWLRRPPTAMLNRRGWDAFRQDSGRNLLDQRRKRGHFGVGGHRGNPGAGRGADNNEPQSRGESSEHAVHIARRCL